MHLHMYVHAQRSPYHTCTRYSCCSLFGSKWSKYHQAWKASLMFVNGEVSGENPLKVRERALSGLFGINRNSPSDFRSLARIFLLPIEHRS